jgi:hypothetical protein
MAPTRDRRTARRRAASAEASSGRARPPPRSSAASADPWPCHARRPQWTAHLLIPGEYYADRTTATRLSRPTRCRGQRIDQIVELRVVDAGGRRDGLMAPAVAGDEAAVGQQPRDFHRVVVAGGRVPPVADDQHGRGGAVIERAPVDVPVLRGPGVPRARDADPRVDQRPRRPLGHPDERHRRQVHPSRGHLPVRQYLLRRVPHEHGSDVQHRQRRRLRLY